MSRKLNNHKISKPLMDHRKKSTIDLKTGGTYGEKIKKMYSKLNKQTNVNPPLK